MSLYTRIIDLQKLDASLQKVLKNKPAPGADGITYDMFEANKKEYLKQLYLELQEHRYHPLPVKLVSLYKGEKERTVALYSMRDKVIQQSIAFELQKIYEPMFSGGTYAYRNGRSALQAIDHMEAQMRRYKSGWMVKMDILEGWEQYYREERKIQSVLEYAVVLYMVRRKEPEVLQKISGLRASFQNTYRELAEYMIPIWKEQERIDFQLLEYEQLYGLDRLDQSCKIDPASPFVQELLAGYEKLMVFEEQEILTELIQDYTELHCLNKAARLMERCQKLRDTGKDRLLSPAVQGSDEERQPELDGKAVHLFCELFVGREDTYAEEYMMQRRVVE